MNCAHLLRFDDVAALVEDMARCLKPGGLLVIRYSNFRLCDMGVGTAFETLLRVTEKERTRLRLFGPDNRVLGADPYLDTVFRKRD